MRLWRSRAQSEAKRLEGALGVCPPASQVLRPWPGQKDVTKGRALAAGARGRGPHTCGGAASGPAKSGVVASCGGGVTCAESMRAWAATQWTS